MDSTDFTLSLVSSVWRIQADLTSSPTFSRDYCVACELCSGTWVRSKNFQINGVKDCGAAVTYDASQLPAISSDLAIAPQSTYSITLITANTLATSSDPTGCPVSYTITKETYDGTVWNSASLVIGEESFDTSTGELIMIIGTASRITARYAA